MREPATYRLEYVHRHGGLFLVGLKGPRGGIRSFPLTRADMARLVDAYSRGCGTSPHPGRAAAAWYTARQEVQQAEGGIPAVRVIAVYLGISIEEATAWWERKQAEAAANDRPLRGGRSGRGMAGKRLVRLPVRLVRRAARLRRRHGAPSASRRAEVATDARASYRIDYDPGAPERIRDRTRDRLRAELGRLDPVEHPAEYNRLFGDLVALEQQRRRQQGQGQGHGQGVRRGVPGSKAASRAPRG
jgi:hypothetical protein